MTIRLKPLIVCVSLSLIKIVPAMAAVSCVDIVRDYNSAVVNNTVAQACYFVTGQNGAPLQVCESAANNVSVASAMVQQYPECFGGLNHGVAIENIRATVFQQMYTVSHVNRERLAALRRPAPRDAEKGLAGGDVASKINMWGGTSQTNSNYDHALFAITPTISATNRFDADIKNYIIGADYQYKSTVTLGVSAAFDNGGGTAYSNAGAKQLDFKGTAISPYLGWQINNDWALDAQIGWGSGKSTVGLLNATDVKRFFYGTNLDYTKWLGNWQVMGKGSYLYGQEQADDVVANGVVAQQTAAKNTLDQLRVGGQVGYWINNLMPYASVSALTERHTSSATVEEQSATGIGRNAMIWTVGANLFHKDKAYGGISFLHESGRDRAVIKQLMANINIRF